MRKRLLGPKKKEKHKVLGKCLLWNCHPLTGAQKNISMTSLVSIIPGLFTFLRGDLGALCNRVIGKICPLKPWNYRLKRDDLAVRSTCYPSKGPEFRFWHPCPVIHNCLLLQIQKNPVPLASVDTCTHVHTCTHTKTNKN